MGLDATIEGVACKRASRGSGQAACAADLTEEHTRCCANSGGQVIAHNDFQRMVVAWVIKGHAHLTCDQNTTQPFELHNRSRSSAARAAQGKACEMDVLFQMGHIHTNARDMQHKTVLCDFTIGDPCSQTHRRDSSATMGACAAGLTTKHHQHYSSKMDLASCTLKVFAAEVYGFLGPEALDLIRAWAMSAAGGPAALNKVQYAAMVFKMKRDVSLALHKAVSTRTLRHVAHSIWAARTRAAAESLTATHAGGLTPPVDVMMAGLFVGNGAGGNGAGGDII
jgi:hypothetical protein